MRENKVAILIPTYNGGALLSQSVASVAEAGLPAGSYEIIVSDNASDDGSVDALPAQDALGAPITIHRNARNIGRVENWNCILECAEELGFSHVMLLMVGDLLRDAGVLALRDRMLRAGAAFGLASYEVVDEEGHRLRIARRVDWRAPADAGISVERFLSQTLSVGAALFGPLGANLYDLRAARLRFDPADPTHTDQYATLAFLHAAGRPVVYLDRPIMQWRERPQRFHSSMNLLQRLNGDRALIERACRNFGVMPDRGKIQSTLILRVLFHSRGNFPAAWSDLQSFMHESAQISWLWMFHLLLRTAINKTPWRVER